MVRDKYEKRQDVRILIGLATRVTSVLELAREVARRNAWFIWFGASLRDKALAPTFES